MLYMQIQGFIIENKEEDPNNKIFKKINKSKLQTSFNTLFDNVHEETSKIYLYMEEKIKEFPKIFEKELKNIIDTMNYLEKIALPNKRECAAIIDILPCWRCLDCTDYDNIYCSDCYIKSKDLHKGHKIHFLPKVEGMCDCGDPNAFKIFCPDHKGPFTEQKQIDEFIKKSFEENILTKLKLFFDDFFIQFSKYLILTEQCKFFCNEIFLNNIHNVREKDDAIMLKDNFCIIFQNFLTFLYVITNKNMGMLYLITNYILRNHFSLNNLDEKFKTVHSCIKIENKNIQILNKNKSEYENIFSNKEENKLNMHICECSFLRLLLTNWRDKIKSNEENKNEELLISFSHNIFLKESFSALYYFISKDIILNNNDDILTVRNQFLSENIILLMGNQTNIIEDSYHFFYEYIKQLFSIPISKDYYGGFNSNILYKLLNIFIYISNDFERLLKPKIIQLIKFKSNLMKIFFDISCLIHNLCEYKSIIPHPEFQAKTFSIELLNCEIFLLKIIDILNICNDWKNNEKTKSIFYYLIKKIINQKSEGIKQLEENEYSFHLTLYRCFGIFLNYFCFNYALNNNKNIYEAIEYIKNNFFKSKEEMEKTIEIIINDYFKMIGFIIGIRNGYFNYYDSLENYNEIYFNKLKFFNTDLTLLKYLLSMSEKKISLDAILKVSNIENIYSFFNGIFKEANSNNKEINEDEKKNILQWVRFFEIIITIMKNDSTHFYKILNIYNIIISSKFQSDLFNQIKNNENMMIDLKNNLKEKLILIFISNGNWLEFQKLKKLIDEYYFKLFNEKEFNEILDELTTTKIDNKKKVYILKDSSFKYLDLNYFFSPVVKSKAELYINDFKKDIFKLYNCYYFKPSPLSFDFHNKVFENILLNNENIELLITILDILLIKENNNPEYISTIKEEFLPVILNYITMLGSINSKIFIKYKIDNKNLFNKLLDILNVALKNTKKNIIFNKDLSENIENTIKQLNKYQIIYDNIKQNLNDLDDFDYNIDYLYKENSNSSNINKENCENNKKKVVSNKMKEKYKNLIKQKRNNFIEKIKMDKRMTNIIEQKEIKTGDKEKDEIMCFFCRNSINLNSFENPYGKIVNIHKDFFYKNSFRSSIRNELNKICKKNIEEKNKIYSNIKENDKNVDISIKIISCGHYFHQQCFKERLNEFGFVKCPVCEKLGNILISPMTNFYSKDIYLKPVNIDDILNKKYEVQKEEIKENSFIFKKVNLSFIQSLIKTKLDPQAKIIDIKKIINELFLNYEYNLNYLGNIFESNATSFYKQQQIDNIQNFILIIRYLVKIDYIDINQIMNYIRSEIDILIKGPNEKENIIENYKNMKYSKQIDRILFLFILLIDINDLQKLFLYIINWSLPYNIFWIYLRNLIIENNCYSLNEEKIKERINIKDFEAFTNDNNKIINDYLKSFLKKLLFIKMIMKFDYKNDDIFNDNYNTLTLEQLVFKLNIDNLYEILPKNINNEINIKDLFSKFKAISIPDNSILLKDHIILDFNAIFNLLINSLIKIKEEKYLLNPEFFYQFILYKFDFIELEYNIFDFIEKKLFQKCFICKQLNKKSFLCLVCGKKICQEELIDHTFKCTLSDIIYIDLQNMKLLCYYNYQYFKILFSVYTNEYNEEPKSDNISKEFNFSKEKYNIALKAYICRDFNFA